MIAAVTAHAPEIPAAIMHDGTDICITSSRPEQSGSVIGIGIDDRSSDSSGSADKGGKNSSTHDITTFQIE